MSIWPSGFDNPESFTPTLRRTAVGIDSRTCSRSSFEDCVMMRSLAVGVSKDLDLV